jgi:hypothetical protein
MDVGHNIVAKLSLIGGGLFEVDVIEVPSHFAYLGLFDIQTQFFLGFCQFKPEPAPGTEFFLRAEKLSHSL